MNRDTTVFVVDDDCFARDLLQQVFESVGMPVRVFPSARELLTSGDLHSRCVLLLDVKMPDMSGPELQTVLHRMGIRVPILFLTGFADVPVAVAAMRSGASDFLVKPVDSATLVDHVRQASERFYESQDRPSAIDCARRLSTLTPREREVFDLMVTGVSSKRIARVLNCSFRTIDIHRARVMAKMSAESLAQLVRMSIDGLTRSGATA